MANAGRFEIVEPERAGRFEVVPDAGRFELVSGEPGLLERVARGVAEPFRALFEGVHQTAQAVERGEAPPSAGPEATAGVFPGFTAVEAGVRAALGGPVPEPLDIAVPGSTGFETLPGGLPGSETLAGLLAGGLAGAPRRILSRIAGRPGAAPAVPIPPRKALPPIGGTGARRTFEVGPSSLEAELGPPGAARLGRIEEAFDPKRLPRDLAEDRRVIVESVGRRLRPDEANDIATKAAIVRAQTGRTGGPRVIDPETGRPMFEPVAPISRPIAEAKARVGREPVGRAGLPSEEFVASTEAPGGRATVGAPPAGRQPGGVHIIPDESTPAAQAKRGMGPIEQVIAIGKDAHAPPGFNTVTFADRVNNILRVVRGRVFPRNAVNLGYDLDIAKAHPSADAIIQAKYASRGRTEVMAEQQQQGFWRIWEGVPEERVDAVMDVWKLHRFQPHQVWLDRAGRQFPQLTDRIARTKEWFDELGQYFVRTGRLTEKQLASNPNYYPWIREQLRVGQEQLKLIESRGDAYFSVWRGNGLTKPFQEFFQRQVAVKTAPKNLRTRDVIRIYSNAVARAQVLDAEFMPVVRANLDKVPSWMQPFVMHNVNHHLGVEGSARAMAAWKNVVKSIQAQRTLVGLSAPAHNLTQQTITISKFGWSQAGPAYADLANPELWATAKRLGVISKYSIKDIGEATAFGNRIGRAWGRVGDISLLLFRGTEHMNRVHALATAMRDASRRGLTGKAAEQWALRGVIETQGPIVKTGVTGQFKTFPLFMLDTYKNMLFDMPASAELFVRAAKTGNKALFREAMRRGATPARFFTVTTALFGGDALLPGADEFVTKRLLGEAMKFEGAVGYLGINLAHAVGIGAIPVENFRSLLFFMPGPAAAQTAEVVSLLTGLRLNPFHGKDLTRMGEPFRTPQDLDEMRARLVRATVILGGVQVNRLIEARKRWVAGTGPAEGFTQRGDVVAATDWYEAFGFTPATGELIQPRGGEAPESFLEQVVDSVPIVRGALEAAGFRPEASEMIQQHMRQIAIRDKAIADTRSAAATLIATGDDAKIDLAARRIEQLGKDHGEEALVEAWDGLKTAVPRQALARVAGRLERRVITGPRAGIAAREELGQRRGIIDAVVRWLTSPYPPDGGY